MLQRYRVSRAQCDLSETFINALAGLTVRFGDADVQGYSREIMRVFRRHEEHPGTYQIFIPAITRGKPPEDESNFRSEKAAAVAAAPLTPEINKLTFLATEDIYGC